MRLHIKIDNAEITFEDASCTARDGEYYFERCKGYIVLATDQLIRVMKEVE